MDDFEAFAREKISRLRAEIDALEKTLKEYQVAMGRSVRSSSGPTEVRSGAFGAVLDALTAAGPAGMSLDDMMSAAQSAGFNMNRNTLRSQLFSAKNKGQVEAMEGQGRYRAPQRKAPERSPPPTNNDGGNPQSRPSQATHNVFDLDEEIPF